MQKITFVLIVCLAFAGYSQDHTRLRGKIVVNALLSLDDVHVINQTLQLGTISNNSGNFRIKANPGDTIIFSSIQYALKQHVVDESDLENETFKIKLEQSVNTLDEVVVSQHTLTGKLEKDILNIPTYTENLPFWSAAELKRMGVSGFNDAQSPVTNTILEDGTSATTINLSDLGKAISEAFRGKRKWISANYKIADFYEEKFVVNELEVPETEYYNFIDFVHEQPETAIVLRSDDKLQILEFLIVQRDVFFETYDIKK
ncbi:carboxypeptidase-like regulatory domain-containing protein [Aquimarina sp. AU474]|uniref:carboxypeptidase-like regulatory domain-containing protein n=1 Tax=Aquimarina sp. AU474 TaxID=2108529 RepID=UPI000D693986|nr:carboxypeptidase-like regulatory domain-containing protein [Aquimarina sp. AU474]